MPNPSRRSLAWTLMTICCAAAILIVGAGLGALFTRGISVTWRGSYEIGYADFIGIVLSALSVLLTVLTIFLAVFGVIGWASFSERLRQNTNEFLSNELSEGGPLYLLIRKEVRDAVYEGVQPLSAEGQSSETPDRPIEANL